MDVPAKATASPDVEELADYVISKFCETEDLDYVQQNSKRINKLSSGKWWGKLGSGKYCSRMFSQKVLQYGVPSWGFRFYGVGENDFIRYPGIWRAPVGEVHLTETGEVHAYDQAGVSVDFTDNGSRPSYRFVTD